MKILIGCPTCERYEDRIAPWLDAVKAIIEFSKLNNHNVDYLLVDNSRGDNFYNELVKKNIKVSKAPFVEDVRQRITDSRNILREKVLNENYDLFFSLEQDVIPKKDALINLISKNKKVISAYLSRLVDLTIQDKETGEIKEITIDLPLIYLQQDSRLKRASPNEILGGGVITVGAFGVGCLLIHREVLEKIKFRVEKDEKAFDDINFCCDAKKLGYGLYLDPDTRVIHLHKSWEGIS